MRLRSDWISLTGCLEPGDGDGPWSDKLSRRPTTVEAVARWLHLCRSRGTVRRCSLGGGPHRRGHVCARQERGARASHEFCGRGQRPDRSPTHGCRSIRLHAFQWLLIACTRAATEYPASLAPFASRFVEWALCDQPQVMIRQFAARTALALHRRGLLPSGDRLEQRLRCVNVTTLPVVESNSFERVSGERRATSGDDDKDRFYFYLDIGPYWYEPLGSVFGLSQNRIETEALKVIRNQLHGSTGDKTWREDERKHRDLYGREKTFASQGIHPDTDDYQFYLSYHAMMIVAGQLLSTIPAHHDRGWSPQDEFDDWLSGHDLTRKDDRWLADRRDPAPLERSAWLDRTEGDTEYGAITLADVKEALLEQDLLNVWGRWWTADWTTIRSVHVRSALVTPDRSRALLRSLSRVDGAHVYEIPAADGQHKHEIDRAGFVLKGWIDVGECDRGLDNKDKWSGGVHYPPPRPATNVVELMDLETDADQRVWCGEDKIQVMSSEVWRHLETRDDDGSPERGERLRASLDFVTDLLGRLGRDLILGVEIETSRRYRRYESPSSDDEQRQTRTGLYLVNVDGRIASL